MTKATHSNSNHTLDICYHESEIIHCEAYIFPAVLQVAFRQEGRRAEVVEWFRNVLRFAAEHVVETRAFDSELAALLLCDVVSLKERSLQPEIKALFDTGLVDIGCCGTYESVIGDIENPMYTTGQSDIYILDIHERFDDMRKCFMH